jgi:hypothetical protein
LTFKKTKKPFPNGIGKGFENQVVRCGQLLGVIDFRSGRHFLELGKRAERVRLLFAGAAAGGGEKSEGGYGEGGDDSEHGGSEMGFFGFREKNDLAGRLQGGPKLGPP